MAMRDSQEFFMFPSRVRCEVLAQHSFLREMLQRALAITTEGLKRMEPVVGELGDAVHELRRHFRAHLAFEERALLPILATEEVWGPERARALVEEHDRQRAELDTLLEGMEDGWDLPHLALTLRSLVVDLLRDMQEEEETRLGDELMGKPLIVARTP
jgi:hypothetical protein